MTMLQEFATPTVSAAGHPGVGSMKFGSGSSGAPRVVVVDDDEMILDLVCAIADLADCASFPVSSLARLDAYLNDSRASDLIILDLNLGETDGVSVLRRLRDRSCKSSIIIASGCEERVRRSAVDFGRQLGLTMLAPIAKPFDHAMMASAIRQFAHVQVPLTEADVANALKAGEFGVHMQPIIDVQSRRVVAAEALVRWHHPMRGMVSPDKFIPMIERRPLMLPLTLEIARLALKGIAEIPGDVGVGINVPPLCIADANFPELLMEAATTHRVAPSRIMLEITETAAMADPVFTAAQLTRLRIKGFGVALDDFGTGYASLVELHRMPVSSIKVDRSFVSHIVRDEDATAIARSIIGLGQSLKLQVVAEGVEDQATLDMLRSWNCELAQGYYIARPMPAADLSAWIKAWDAKSTVHTFD